MLPMRHPYANDISGGGIEYLGNGDWDRPISVYERKAPLLMPNGRKACNTTTTYDQGILDYFVPTGELQQA